ncbi:MAG: helix-turn-helix domain-containing protein [Thermoleophilaceae bacterium]
MLDVAEAGRRLGRDPETIRRWIRAGRLRAQKVGNKHVIDEADLAAAADEPHSIGVPPELERFESGESQPDWVKLIHRSRAGH